MESSSRVNVSNPSASTKATSIASAITSFTSRISECGRPRARCAALFLIGLVCLLPAGSGLADEGSWQAQTAALRDELSRLEAREGAADVSAALDQARRALQAASGPIEDPNAAVRAQQIARAAMALAERQLELRQAQTELIAAQRRLASMRGRADSQRRALEALMRLRASTASGAAQR